MPFGILYVFAKEPEPGHVKTRLCPPLVPEQAAELAEAFLADMLGTLCSGSDALFEVRLAVSPGAGGPRLAALADRFGLAVQRQGSGDLGRRMGRVMREGLEQAEIVALLGGDLPDLPAAYVRAAFDMLAGERSPGGGVDPRPLQNRRPAVVLGPSSDGGYYLVAARRSVERLFDIEAAWGGNAVLDATEQRLSTEGVEYALLPRWGDVDDAGGLRDLRRRLRGDAHDLCPRTRAALARLRIPEGQP